MNLVVQKVRTEAESLIGVEWLPFSSAAQLLFRTADGGRIVLRLGGVHLFLARQSVREDRTYVPLADEHSEDLYLHYFDVVASDAFLEKFIRDDLGLSSRVCLYSVNGASCDSSGFIRPVHLTLVAGCGHLDVVCESVDINSEIANNRVHARRRSRPG